jgi:hypothetical protein
MEHRVLLQQLINAQLVKKVSAVYGTRRFILCSQEPANEGHVARMIEVINAYKILFGEPEGRRPIGIPRLKCGDNIKIDLKEIVWEVVE